MSAMTLNSAQGIVGNKRKKKKKKSDLFFLFVIIGSIEFHGGNTSLPAKDSHAGPALLLHCCGEGLCKEDVEEEGVAVSLM